MASSRLTFEQNIQKIRADVQAKFPDVEILDNSFVNGAVVATASSGQLTSMHIDEVERRLHPASTTGVALESWSSTQKLTRNTGTFAFGNIILTGVLGTFIPTNTEWTINSKVYETFDAPAQIFLHHNIAISLILSGQTATAVTETTHGFATGQQNVLISGADQPEYNGFHTIFVVDATTFQYEIIGSPVSPATGVIHADADMASMTVTTVVGSAGNITTGASGTIVSSIPGLDDTCFVGLGGITGGTDVETDTDFRNRMLCKFAEPPPPFGEQDIINVVKQLPQASHVLPKRAGSIPGQIPLPGQVLVYFTVKNTTSVIPTTEEIFEVKTNIEKIVGITMPDPVSANLFVLAPTPISVTFQFSSISPNTSTMQQAIKDNLKAFFQDFVKIEKDLLAVQYNCAISKTIDPNTGAQLESFILFTPATNISISTGEVAVLGSVFFNV